MGYDSVAGTQAADMAKAWLNWPRDIRPPKHNVGS